MHTRLHRFTAGALAIAFTLLFAAPPQLFAQAAQPAAAASTGAPQDRWPRKFTANGSQVDLYTPQLDSWDGRTIEWHAAVSVTAPGAKEPTFGVVFSKAKTDVDKTTRLVELTNLEVTSVNFPSAPAANDTYLAMMRKALLAKKTVTVALDKLEANLAILQEQKKGDAAPLKNEPPAIVFSSVPAILVLVDGEPAWRAVPNTDLQRVINTSPIILKDKTGALYLHLYDGWMRAAALGGPWAVATAPPASLEKALKQILDAKAGDPLTGGTPDDPESKDVQQPTLKTGPIPVVYTATSPTELIVTDGAPNYVPIDGTQLLYVKNTTGRVFKSIADQKSYVLVSGRWFSAPGPEGPWAFVPFDGLPKDFASIPDDSAMENVKASVPGTQQAQEAVVSNSIPQTSAVEISKVKPTAVTVDGQPQMKAIEGTSLQYVVNASSPIIMVTPSAFYLCQNGIWFVGGSAAGPWTVATSVPAVIYSIPPTSPVYNVTFVRVYDATPTVVYVGYTPGYQGAIVYNGVVVYGTGYYYTPWIGTYWYGPPVTYGFGLAIALLALDRLGLRLRLRLRLGLGARHDRRGLGLGRMGLGLRVGRLVRRMARRLLRRRVGRPRRRGLGPGLRALVHRQRLPLLGRYERRLALGRRLQRLDRQRVARPVGRGLQLEDRNARGRPARLGLERLHRQLCDGRPRRRDEHEDRHDRRRARRHGRQRLHRQLGLGRTGEGLQPEHRQHDEGRRGFGLQRRQRRARRRHGRRQDVERRLLRHEGRQRLQEHRQRLAGEGLGLEQLVERQRPGENLAALQGELRALDRPAALRQLPVQRRRLAQPEQLGRQRLAQRREHPPSVAPVRRRRPPPLVLQVPHPQKFPSPHGRGERVRVRGGTADAVTLTAAAATASAAARPAGSP